MMLKLPVYITDSETDMTLIRIDKKVGLVFFVGFGSQHRPVHGLTTTARAWLACPIARATRVWEW